MAIVQETAALDATAQAELVRRGDVSPSELVDAAIERIERLNPQINAVITPMFDEARRVSSGPLPDGPFQGVPFVLKDLIASYGGVRMCFGSRMLENFVSPHDSELVARYKRAGLVCVGKTSTPEFGLLPTTEPVRFGPARNPWDTSRTTGGSSGGSAAAVACGMTPVGHGNDGGGSIRIPASCCGLFGLKPTRGRNPLGPDYGDVVQGLVCEHMLTKSVRDSAALLDVSAGPMVGDPYWAPPPARLFAKEVGANPGKLRIAYTKKSATGTPIHPDCIAAVEDAAKLCGSLGHEVTEAAPDIPGDEITRPFMAVFVAQTGWAIDGLQLLTGVEPKEEMFEPGTWAMYQMASDTTASQYMLAWSFLQQVSRMIAVWMQDYDVWLTPTLGEPPLPLGTLDATPENPLHGLFRSAEFVPFTPLCNFTGQPAMSLPLFWNGDGLPIGTHFVGRFGDEATLFRLAAQLEEARPWADRRPPVFA